MEQASMDTTQAPLEPLPQFAAAAAVPEPAPGRVDGGDADDPVDLPSAASSVKDPEDFSPPVPLAFSELPPVEPIAEIPTQDAVPPFQEPEIPMQAAVPAFQEPTTADVALEGEILSGGTGSFSQREGLEDLEESEDVDVMQNAGDTEEPEFGEGAEDLLAEDPSVVAERMASEWDPEIPEPFEALLTEDSLAETEGLEMPEGMAEMMATEGGAEIPEGSQAEAETEWMEHMEAQMALVDPQTVGDLMADGEEAESVTDGESAADGDGNKGDPESR